MSASPVQSGPQGARVFRAACVVLGLVAAGQAAATAFAPRRMAPTPVAEKPAAKPAELPPVPAPAAAKPSPDDPFSITAPAVLDDPHPEMAVPAGDPPALADPAELLLMARSPGVITVPPPLVQGVLDVPITQEECLKHLDEGVYLRETQGDTLTALKHLEAALRLVPDHPKLIYQVALTLDIMGLEKRALREWRVLRALGEGAGNYYQLAVNRLNGANPALIAAADESDAAGEEAQERRFFVAGVKTERLPTPGGSEALEFRVTVQHAEAGPVKMEDLGLVIHFFDEVNGQSIDRTSAQTPELSSVDGEIDWAGGKEEFRFEYVQAPMSPQEVERLGPRKYFGYVIELVYESRLQDVSAEPQQLTQFARDIPVPGEDGAAGDEPPVLMPGDMAPPSLFPPALR